MAISAGINGFGRFGLHLLKFWLDRNSEARFSIDYINDDTLDIHKAREIICTDRYVKFNKYKVLIEQSSLVFLEPNGKRHQIPFTNQTSTGVDWLGKPDILFECSGKHTVASTCEPFLKDNTKTVLISATSWDAPQTLVYGFNHRSIDRNERVFSYGSCTVNAFVPLAQFIHDTFGIEDSDVNVVHNIQEYRLDGHQTLLRKFCTLEKSGPALLDFLDENNFIVNYTVVPYTGVSLMDFRFRLKTPISSQNFTDQLVSACNEGSLKGLYGFDEVDIGPEVHNCTPFSTVFIKQKIKRVGDNIYMQGYFDTENSVNRYFDLANYITAEM